MSRMSVFEQVLYCGFMLEWCVSVSPICQGGVNISKCRIVVLCLSDVNILVEFVKDECI